MDANPTRTVTWVVVTIIAFLVIRPLFRDWYGDSMFADFLVGATACGLGLAATVVVAWLKRGRRPN